MGRRRQQRQKSWNMYPSLDDEVQELLEEDDLSFEFYRTDSDDRCIKEYDTNIMGKFTCDNRACSSTGWSSKKIAITIRLYGNQRYNARVYYQRCLRCNHLSEPDLDSSYAERVAYRLKKWSGIQQEQPVFLGQSTGPHQSEHCEGCKHGHCTQGRSNDFF